MNDFLLVLVFCGSVVRVHNQSFMCGLFITINLVMTSKKSSLFLCVCSVMYKSVENTQKCNKAEIIEINTCTT